MSSKEKNTTTTLERTAALQFSCTQENLRTAVTLVGHIAARQGSLPILSNVLVRAEGKALTVLATNLELAMSYGLRGKVEQDGAVTANAKLLGDVVQLLPHDRVDVVVDDAEITLTCRGNATKVRGMDAVEFPLIPVVERRQEAVVAAGALRDALGAVAFAVASGSARPELSGVLFAFDGTSAKVVATDSYRLGEATLPLTTSTIPKGTQVIVPGRTVQEILRVVSVLMGSEEPITEVAIAVTANQLLVTAGALTITSRLIDGTYPDYTQILPRSWSTRVVVPRGELQTAARRAALFSRTGINDVHLRILPKGNQVVIRSENAQVGEDQATLDVSAAKGDEVVVVLNARYLLEGLAAISGDEVAMECSGATAPVALRPAEGEGYVYIIMPIKQ